MSRTILFMAGGTGGHIFPALAVAEALRQRGEQVLWLGSEQGMEQQLVPTRGIALLSLKVAGVRGKGWWTRLLAPWRLVQAVWQAVRILRRVRPDLVVGMGGFASGPGGLAAWLLSIPLVIHEQNAAAGLTNKALARVAQRVLQAFPSAFTNGLTLGNPVRAEVVNLAAPEQRFAGRTGPLRLLVLGGSQGAQIFNQQLPAFLASLPVEQRPLVWHQTGQKLHAAALASYHNAGLAVDANALRVAAFIDDMAAAYQWADLVIARAGALTVSELACAGLAALLVPYPHAVDDHQTANARYLTEAGAAWLSPQAQTNLASLQLWWTGLERAELLQRAIIARQLSHPDAVQQVITQMDQLLVRSAG